MESNQSSSSKIGVAKDAKAIQQQQQQSSAFKSLSSNLNNNNNSSQLSSSQQTTTTTSSSTDNNNNVNKKQLNANSLATATSGGGSNNGIKNEGYTYTHFKYIILFRHQSFLLLGSFLSIISAASVLFYISLSFFQHLK
jgi:hypothetical protein